MTTAFDPSAFGTPNPDWAKRRVEGFGSLRRLADHICTRTPPRSFGDREALVMSLLERCQPALRSSDIRPYNILADLIEQRLVARDGSL